MEEQTFSIRHVSAMSGVSIRTLRLYDEIGLLQPLVRTEARYRLYGKNELLRLQQILFYKELDIPLATIRKILDNPAFDTLTALYHHHKELLKKKDKIEKLLQTLTHTIQSIEGELQMNYDDLYQGFDTLTAEAYRKEAKEKYGAESVEQSEHALLSMKKKDFQTLQVMMRKTLENLFNLSHKPMNDEEVQGLIHEYYRIIRELWGTSSSEDSQAEQFIGLGQLYCDDERFYLVNNCYNKEFAEFMAAAMKYYAEKQLY